MAYDGMSTKTSEESTRAALLAERDELIAQLDADRLALDEMLGESPDTCDPILDRLVDDALQAYADEAEASARRFDEVIQQLRREYEGEIDAHLRTSDEAMDVIFSLGDAYEELDDLDGDRDEYQDVEGFFQALYWRTDEIINRSIEAEPICHSIDDLRDLAKKATNPSPEARLGRRLCTDGYYGQHQMMTDVLRMFLELLRYLSDKEIELEAALDESTEQARDASLHEIEEAARRRDTAIEEARMQHPDRMGVLRAFSVFEQRERIRAVEARLAELGEQLSKVD